MSTNPKHRFESSLQISSTALIVVNLLPALGAIFYDWDVLRLMALFWAENAFIGALGIARLIMSGGRGASRALFFVVHYSAFMFAHAVFLVTIFSPGSVKGIGFESVSFLLTYLGRWDVALVAFALLGSHLWSYASNFLGGQEFKQLRPMDAMRLPYQRIAITQFALIIGGFAVQELGNPLAGLLVLVAVKTFADLRSHRKEHRLLAIPVDKTEPNIR